MAADRSEATPTSLVERLAREVLDTLSDEGWIDGDLYPDVWEPAMVGVVAERIRAALDEAALIARRSCCPHVAERIEALK